MVGSVLAWSGVSVGVSISTQRRMPSRMVLESKGLAVVSMLFTFKEIKPLSFHDVQLHIVDARARNPYSRSWSWFFGPARFTRALRRANWRLGECRHLPDFEVSHTVTIWRRARQVLRARRSVRATRLSC